MLHFLFFPFFSIMNYQDLKSMPIDSKTVFLESIKTVNHSEKIEFHENSLEMFLSELSNLRQESLNPEEQDEEQERLQALYIAIVERLNNEYDSEEFYGLIMTDENLVCSDISSENFEGIVDCIVNEYLSRKRKNQ